MKEGNKQSSMRSVIEYASSEGQDEPEHMLSVVRGFVLTHTQMYWYAISVINSLLTEKKYLDTYKNVLHRRAEKAQTNLRIHPVSSVPSLLTHAKLYIEHSFNPLVGA